MPLTLDVEVLRRFGLHVRLPYPTVSEASSEGGTWTVFELRKADGEGIAMVAIKAKVW